MDPKERIIVALDTSDFQKAFELVNKLSSHVGCFKIGFEFMNSALAELLFSCNDDHAIHTLIWLRSIVREAGNIFWDGKFNDIPNTVAGATRAVRSMGVKFFDVHASAGIEAVRSAAENKGNAKLLVVTVLTSLQFPDLWNIGFGRCRNPGCKRYAGVKWSVKFVEDLVLTMAKASKGYGADGIICSPKELPLIAKDKTFDGFIKVVPGVRPKWAAANDQKRFMTPGEAIRAGADYLVIGRPIINPPKDIGSPVEAVKLIIKEIEEAERSRTLQEENEAIMRVVPSIVKYFFETEDAIAKKKKGNE